MFYDSGLLYTILHWFVSASALMLTAYLVPGFRVKNFSSALIAAVVIGLANAFIRPVLLFLTLPFNILTLGLFTFVVDGVILKACSGILGGFDIKGWGAAIFGAFCLAVIATLLHMVIV